MLLTSWPISALRRALEDFSTNIGNAQIPRWAFEQA
jgi:hypothetical protein